MNHEGMDRNASKKQIEIPGTEILVEKLLITRVSDIKTTSEHNSLLTAGVQRASDHRNVVFELLLRRF